MSPLFFYLTSERTAKATKATKSPIKCSYSIAKRDNKRDNYDNTVITMNSI